MPEGPEVRKFADALDSVLSGRRIISLEARTRVARAWLSRNHARLVGGKVKRVFSHGKHLVGLIQPDFYFHSHLMMWGRWQTYAPAPPLEVDRRERARIIVEGGAAILYSAPIFTAGEGDPYKQVEYLGSLGPDVLPYSGKFDGREFRRRLRANFDTTVGAALLNQQIVAGLGNYLRAEVLFTCGINPWTKVADLKRREVSCLSETVPELSLRSYRSGATASADDRERMSRDESLVYQKGREYGTRHMVFRRTNLPCLRCDGPIRQLRQITHVNGEEERDRIIYFCERCQNVPKEFRN